MVGIAYLVIILLIAQGLGGVTFDLSNIVGTLTEGGVIALVGGGIGACIGSVLRGRNPDLDGPSQDVKAQPSASPDRGPAELLKDAGPGGGPPSVS